MSTIKDPLMSYVYGKSKQKKESKRKTENIIKGLELENKIKNGNIETIDDILELVGNIDYQDFKKSLTVEEDLYEKYVDLTEEYGDKEDSNSKISKYYAEKIFERIIYQYAYKHEDFNYVLIRAESTSLRLDTADILILKQMYEMTCIKKYNLGWILTDKYYKLLINNALSWSKEKMEALIFKYKPSNTVINKRRLFDDAREKYKRDINDENYDIMYQSFVDLFQTIYKEL